VIGGGGFPGSRFNGAAVLATGAGATGIVWSLTCCWARVVFATQPTIPSQPISPAKPSRRTIRAGVIMTPSSNDVIRCCPSGASSANLMDRAECTDLAEFSQRVFRGISRIFSISQA